MPDYTFNDVVDAYRRMMEFNVGLLVMNFRVRYDFKVQEHVKKMRYEGKSEDRIKAYLTRSENSKERRIADYKRKLEDGIRPSVDRYSENLRAAFGFAERSVEEE